MYGTHVPHLSSKDDKYGFVDEREIRIATGITLMMAHLSLFLVLLKAEFDIPLVLVSLMAADFVLKVFIGPRWSIFGSFVRLFLSKGNEIWVGAVQKRFAWSIGVFLSVFVIYCLLLLGAYISPMEGPQMTAVSAVFEGIRANILSGALIVTPMNPAIIACVLCLIFMWLESVVGYCVGCHIYGWLVKKGWMKRHNGQNCANGVCEMK